MLGPDHRLIIQSKNNFNGFTVYSLYVRGPKKDVVEEVRVVGVCAASDWREHVTGKLWN